MPFERLIGAAAFLALIPFIILYLRRPRPSEQTIPSLMFFMRERGTTRFHSFLRNLIHNLLFLLQLAILSLLAFSVMGFFTEVTAEKTGKNVIVLDVSASMQTAFDGSTRFQHAVSKAGEFLEGSTSIVLAANVPRVVLENGGSREARRILSTLEPLDASSNIGEAIVVASDLLEGKGEIIVLSDFLATEGLDPVVARRAASENAVVRFFSFASKADNVGLIRMDVSKALTAVTVKNFNDGEESFEIRLVNGNSVSDSRSVSLPPNSLEEFSFETLPGDTEVRIAVDDDFPADNAAFVSIPGNIKAKALLVTNAESSNLEAALRASPFISLEIANPPVVGSFDYDVIALHKFQPDLMLPGHYEGIEDAVMNGSSVIITGQDDLASAGIGFLPVDLTGTGNVSGNVVNITNFFTDGIDFGVNERFLASRAGPGAVTLVSASDSPVLTISELGSGMVVYYGILDDYSSFKSSPTYPRFWSRLVSFLTGTEDVANFNVETGRVEVVREQSVLTPKGSVRTDRVLFDHSGFYAFDSRRVAANLLNVRESEVSSDDVSFSDGAVSSDGGASRLKETRHFDAMLALIAGILLFGELLFIKFRGDL